MGKTAKLVVAALFAGGFALGAAGCDSGDVCENMMDNMEELAEAAGEEEDVDDAEIEEMLEECREGVEESEEFKEAVECYAEADSEEDLMDCPAFPAM